MAEVTEEMIKRTRGDTYPISVTLKDSSGVAIDITGGTFALTVNSEENPTDTANQLFTEAGTITNAVGGVVEFAVSLSNSDQTPGVYYYDVQYTDSAGNIRTVLRGPWCVNQDITK
jgi:hypothetical protein